MQTPDFAHKGMVMDGFVDKISAQYQCVAFQDRDPHYHEEKFYRPSCLYDENPNTQIDGLYLGLGNKVTERGKSNH